MKVKVTNGAKAHLGKTIDLGFAGKLKTFEGYTSYETSGVNYNRKSYAANLIESEGGVSLALSNENAPNKIIYLIVTIL